MNVLIVNNYTIGDCNPVGNTMKNMLLDMPDVNWLQYCVDYRAKEHIKLTEVLFCDVNDSLAYKIKAKKNLDGHSAVDGSKPQASAENTQKTPAVPPKTVLPTGNTNDKKGDILRAVFYSMRCGVSNENLRRIKEFKPDVIYTMGENIRVINQSIKLSKKLHIPIVFHCMDDFKSTMYTSSPVAKVFNKHLKARMKRMNKYSVENLGICQKMADYYSKTYKKPYSYASNCALKFNEEPYIPDADKPMKIIFSGSLHFHRGDTLYKLADVIDKLNSNGYAMELEIYAPGGHLSNYPDYIGKHKHTKWQQFVPESQKYENMASADILLHVESFEESDKIFMKYSFSTKLVEYFASGRCVVGLGSKEISSIEFIQNNCGMSAENLDELESILKDLCENPEKRIKYAKKSLEIAKEVFGKESTQKRIYDVFRASAKKS